MCSLWTSHPQSNIYFLTITTCTHRYILYMEKLMICLVLGLLLCVNVAECKKHDNKKQHEKQEIQYSEINCRKHIACLTDFGGVGDGTTLNTNAFKKAISSLSKLASDGGAMLFVPNGTWLTGSFDLASHFTLYIHQDAVLLATQEESAYPLIEPLPSYGIGRDGGKRYSSLIMGKNLTDVVITGGNGTIDGQGDIWWEKFKNHELHNTRPYLIEILFSNQVQISNLTLKNSPSWHVHPTYCTDVVIEHLTIIAPVSVPNTDGINPDSCTNTRIRDSFIVSGDDCIAVKSGWDEYGIRFGMPTQNLSITRLTCTSPKSAGIAIGSEMSGGIRSVRAENIDCLNCESVVRIKTAIGRGGYVKDIYVRKMKLDTIKYIFWMTGAYGSHPDPGYDPKALPKINNINFRDVDAKNVTFVGDLSGINGDTFTGICVSNVTAVLAEKKKLVNFEFEEKMKNSIQPWNCTNISGVSSRVKPKACSLLPERNVDCVYPDDKLAIDTVVLKECSITLKARN